jgi:hypothetical protein
MRKDGKSIFVSFLYFSFLFTLIVFFWNTPLLYPIKLLVVLLHEMSHGIAGILTGGKVDKITICTQLGGACYISGGWDFVILPAGYLGSMFWGALLMLLASERRIAAKVSLFFSVILLFVTIIYVRTWAGILIGLGAGFFFLFLSFKASAGMNKFFLQLIGFTSSLYAIIDIKEDLIDRTVPGSDAYEMSKKFFFSSLDKKSQLEHTNSASSK